MNYNIDYIDLLIRRCLDRTASAEERKILLRVLKYTSDVKIEARILAAFQQDQVIVEPTSVVWANIEQQITTVAQIRRLSIYKRGLSLLKYAAVILFFLIIPLYFFKDPLTPILNELQPTSRVDEIIEFKSKTNGFEVFDKDIQLVLSTDRILKISGRDSIIGTGIEDCINVLYTDNKIIYSVKDSLKQAALASVLYHTIKVPYRKRFSVTLLDGTHVLLNSGTELKYPINAQAQQMDLYLTGEAYFDVSKSRDRKFNVHLKSDKYKKEHIVQVLGTQFNIRAFAGDNYSVTTLFEGAIQVWGIQANPIKLEPSKQITVGEQFFIADADLDNVSAWRLGLFYFKNSPLRDVCRELERWYGVKIRYEKGVENKKLLAQISRSKTLQEVLDMLAQTYDVKYQYKGKEVVLME